MNLKITLAGILSLFCSIALFSQNEELLFSPKGIAEIHITLLNGKKIGDIKNNKNDKDYVGKLEATMQIKNSTLSDYASDELYNGRILITGRGNTTWGVPKRPYNIDLVASDGEKISAPLLGMPEGDEWCLLAFWHDRSLMRIPLAMYLGQHLSGIQWTPKLRYFELWINNEYRGLYCISEKIQRSDHRIDIKKLTDAAEDQIEPRISGGYILEGSSEEKLTPDEIEVQFRTMRDINFTFKYPKPKNVTRTQREWIKNYINEFETVLWDDKKFKDPVIGYQKYIDVESFIDWTILHEQSRGVDNFFHASTFVQKDRNGKLKMSAPWDFDLSYGNAGDRQETGDWVRKHRWFDRLSKDEAYLKKYKDRWDELTPLFNQYPQLLEANYKQLEEAGVIDRESDKWPQILSEFSGEDNQATPYFHRSHIRFLSDWIRSRDTWCYIALGATNQEKGDRMLQSRPTIRVMDPEALDAGRFYVKVMKGYSYYWNDSPTATDDNLKRISAKGKYWVKMKDEWGNISLTSDTLYVGVEPPVATAGSADMQDRFFTCNNPVKEFLDITYRAAKSFATPIQLLDIKGTPVINERVSFNPGDNRIQISTSGLASGIYILRINTDAGTVSKKIAVE